MKAGVNMDIAKLTSKGQLTIPRDIREKLSLQQGDKVLFMEDNGRVYILNSSLSALHDLTNAMRGEAVKQGPSSEADVNELVRDVRRSRHKG